MGRARTTSFRFKNQTLRRGWSWEFELWPFIEPSVFQPRIITAREWRLHIALFVLTIVTTTLAGVALSASDFKPTDPPLSSLLDYLLYLPLFFYYCVDLVKYALRIRRNSRNRFLVIAACDSVLT